MNDELFGSLTIKYRLKANQAVILSCTGTSGYIKLPDLIEDIPVTEVGPYSFSSPEALSGKKSYKEEDIKEYHYQGLDVPFTTMEVLYGKKIKEIFLPAEITRIDEYAFYNCTELETIHLGNGNIDFGNGAFMNCDNLKNLHFRTIPEADTGLFGFLRELQGELKVSFEKDGKRAEFIFPEYYEESVENTPARVFHYLIHGAGYRYRQCLKAGILEIPEYDALFSAPEIQTEEDTALSIALCRLRYPYGLSGANRLKYISYLKNHGKKTIKRYILDNDAKGLITLKAEGILTIDLMDYAIKRAIKYKQPECMGVLLSLQEDISKNKHDRFEL